MKKLFKKRATLCLLIIILLTGSTQVYAATALDTNIVSLIKVGCNSIKDYFLQTTDEEVSKIETDNSNDIKQYIDNSSKKVINDLKLHKNSEIDRANKEIDSHVNDIKKQFDTVINDEKSKSKQLITEKINNSVEDIKENLNKDMEKYIKEILKK